jgi:Ras-related protein Rab-10
MSFIVDFHVLRRFLETSAKTNVNIERAFMELSENILEKTPGLQEPRAPLPPVVNSRANSGCCSS